MFRGLKIPVERVLKRPSARTASFYLLNGSKAYPSREGHPFYTEKGMISMLDYLKNTADTFTENGAAAFSASGSDCLDLFFKAGAFRNADEETIAKAVINAYIEDCGKAMKIVFFARDVRGGLGERRFFRIAIRTLAAFAPESVRANIRNIAEYGRYDDLCALLETPCEAEAVSEIKERLIADAAAMAEGKPVSLLAKWLPSVNASSAETVRMGRYLCKKLKMSERDYRRTLSGLRKYTDIIENRLRVSDYSFDYPKQPSGAMFKYRQAFLRNDQKRYTEFLGAVRKGEAKLNASTLYPYEVIRRALEGEYSPEERTSLDVTWNSLASYGSGTENSNAIAVVDGSGSMTWAENGGIRPIDAAISLGIYFAEHNKGAFGGHFITFSMHPRLIEVKGSDIVEKARYCASYDECANTDIEAVFDLILNTAVRNKLAPAELPSRMYIISDMEFDVCAEGGNSLPMFAAMKRKFARYGYKLPDVIFWNVNSRSGNVPVRLTDTGAALVSGASPAIFDMVKTGEISPERIMNDILSSDRYKPIKAA